MGVALDLHQAVDRHRPGPGHAADVVAAEVDEHDVLGALLQVAEQLLLEPLVLGGIGSAPARAGQGTGLDPPPFDLNELLRRRADDVTVATQGQEVHVRRRVDRAKAAVDVEGARGERLLETLRGDDLECVAADDVFASGVDHGVELAFGHVRLPAGAVCAMRRRGQRVAREPLLHGVDSCHRLGVVLALRTVDGQQL